MRAAIVERAGSLKVSEIGDPQVEEYDALCELLYGATCTGTDWHIIDGSFFLKPRYPLILGHESVGRVVEVGRKVRNFKVGDLITRVGAPAVPGSDIASYWGGFSELGIARDHYAMCADGRPKEDWWAYRRNQVLPHSVSPECAPMFTTWRETLSFLHRIGVRRGSRLLILGSGGNGAAFAAHALGLEASCVAMVGSDRFQQRAERLGVQAYFDYKKPEVQREVGERFPDGFDVVIDAVGRVENADRFLGCVCDGGSYTIYGVDEHGRIRIDPMAARGRFVYQPCTYEESETHHEVVELFLRGRLDAGIWYDANKPFALNEIESAFAYVKNRKALKALVKLH